MPIPKALGEELAAVGAILTPIANRAEISSFGDWKAECATLAEGAGLVVLQNRTQIELTGRDRATFLHSFCTNDIRSLAPGQGREAFLCNVQGKLLGHALIFCQTESLILETVPDQAERIIKHLDRYLIREQVELVDRSQDWSELLLAGQQAERLLDGLGVAPPPLDRLSHYPVSVGGCQVSVRRVDFVSSPAYLLSVETAHVATVWNFLRAAGARPCGWQAFEFARIEARWPWYGQDMNEDNLPQEIARDTQAISFVKGCYLGQETVARIDALGHVNKLLYGVRFSAATPPAIGAALSMAGKDVGRVTSASADPIAEGALALAMLKRGSHVPGQRVESEGGIGVIVA